MKLLPRLDRSEINLVFARITEFNAGPETALELVNKSELRPHWNPSGGIPISERERKEFAEKLRTIAKECGYPKLPNTVNQQRFDRSVCRALADSIILLEAGADTRRSACWAGLSTLLVPDLAVWRHAGDGKKISADRLLGGQRNFLRRLWLRTQVLVLDVNAEEASKWALIDGLTEDAFVQILERPSIAGDKRLSTMIGMEWLSLHARGVDMEPVMRLATRRIRALAQTRMLVALDDGELRSIVANAFDYAMTQLQGEALWSLGGQVKKYKLLSASGETVLSEVPGALGGNSKAKIYGRLDCSAANRTLSAGYAQYRVFFANESDAIQAGYRPCGSCMRDRYTEWISGPDSSQPYPYPWVKLPD